LIVEDEPVQAAYLTDLLEQKGYSVCGVAATCDDALSIALAERPHVVVADWVLPGPRDKDGVGLAASLRSVYKFGLIFVTGHPDAASGLRRMRGLKPDAIIAKPIDGQVFLNAVMRAVQSSGDRAAL
jgi:DNA-binding response OmpR family regulator